MHIARSQKLVWCDHTCAYDSNFFDIRRATNADYLLTYINLALSNYWSGSRRVCWTCSCAL